MRKTLRDFKASAIRVIPRKRPIIIFGLRRGGSTMVADAVAANRGVWFANEPYAVLPAHPAFELKKSLLPYAEHSHFFNLSNDKLTAFENYTRALLEGEYRSIGTCRKCKVALLSDRIALKVLNATWMLPWFISNTESDILCILRHPAGQALSVMRQGWDFPVKAYWNNRDVLEEYFNTQQMRMSQEIMQSNNIWKMAVLDWVVCSLPMRRYKGESISTCKYEDIVLKPKRFVENILSGRLKLKDTQASLVQLGKPSGSSRMSVNSTIGMISNGRKESLITSWNTQIDDRQRIQGREILEAFDVHEYSFDNPYNHTSVK